jgi:hypothetical protein
MGLALSPASQRRRPTTSGPVDCALSVRGSVTERANGPGRRTSRPVRRRQSQCRSRSWEALRAQTAERATNLGRRHRTLGSAPARARRAADCVKASAADLSLQAAYGTPAQAAYKTPARRGGEVQSAFSSILGDCQVPVVDGAHQLNDEVSNQRSGPIRSAHANAGPVHAGRRRLLVERLCPWARLPCPRATSHCDS